MAVTFTTNIALAKPDKTEVAKNWATSTQVALFNNNKIVDFMDVNLIPYTPVLTAQTTAPNLGIGGSIGEYCEVQGFIFGNFMIEAFDAGITSGTGEYGISLPTLIDTNYHVVGTALNNAMGAFHVIGEAYIRDDSAVATSGAAALDVVTFGGVAYVRLVTETFGGKTSPVFTSGSPFALANNDRFVGQFFYKKG